MNGQWTITIEGSVPINEDEVWPDGDGPQSPTANDVARCMEGCGPQERVLEDWRLLSVLAGVRVWVDGVEVWRR